MEGHGQLVFAGRHVIAGSTVTYAEWIDGSLLVVSDDDPSPKVATADDFDVMCLGCLRKEWPEADEALREATRHGWWST